MIKTSIGIVRNMNINNQDHAASFLRFSILSVSFGIASPFNKVGVRKVSTSHQSYDSYVSKPWMNE